MAIASEVIQWVIMQSHNELLYIVIPMFDWHLAFFGDHHARG